MLHSELFELQCIKCNHSTFSLEKRQVCVNCKEELPENKQTIHRSGLFKISQPKSIVVKPTVGSFSRGYSSKSLLHVGVSDSLGNVFNFDERGILIDNGWSDCLCISLNDPFVENNHNNNNNTHWDKELNSHFFAERSQLTKPNGKYHQLQNNCYDFVLRFLNRISYEKRTNHTKEELVQSLIGTPMDTLESFLTIMKKIRDFYDEPFVIKTPNLNNNNNNNNSNRETYRCDICGDRIIGKRFRCQNTETCKDFDICDSCHSKEKIQAPHELSHKLELFESS